MDEEVASAAIIIGLVFKKCKHKRKNRTKWTKEWLLQRAVHGTYDALLKDLRFTKKQDYNNYLRMTSEDYIRITSEDFGEILQIIEPDITKQDGLFFVFLALRTGGCHFACAWFENHKELHDLLSIAMPKHDRQRG